MRWMLPTLAPHLSVKEKYLDFFFLKGGERRGIVGDSSRGGRNQEGVKAIAGIVELQRCCLAGSHNACTLRKKEGKKKHLE